MKVKDLIEQSLLTDEEIEEIPLTNWGGNEDDLNIAKAQIRKTLKTLKEYADGKWIRFEGDDIYLEVDR